MITTPKSAVFDLKAQNSGLEQKKCQRKFNFSLREIVNPFYVHDTIHL